MSNTENKLENGNGSDALTCSALASRWSKYEIDAAAGVVNDIAEDIDNGESREDLRTSLAIYADLLYDASVNRNLSETSQLLEKLESIWPNVKEQPPALTCGTTENNL